MKSNLIHIAWLSYKIIKNQIKSRGRVLVLNHGTSTIPYQTCSNTLTSMSRGHLCGAISTSPSLLLFLSCCLPSGHLVSITPSPVHVKGRCQYVRVAFVLKLLSAGILCSRREVCAHSENVIHLNCHYYHV